MLFRRYAVNADEALFEEAVALCSTQLGRWRTSPDPASSPEVGVQWLHLAGRLRQLRYELRGRLDDLRIAHDALEEALGLTVSHRQRSRADLQYHLAQVLLHEYDASLTSDLTVPERLARESLAVQVPDDQGYGLHLHLHADVRRRQGLQAEDPVILRDAVRLLQDAAEATATLPSFHWRALNTLAVARMQLYLATGDRDELPSAVTDAKRALASASTQTLSTDNRVRLSSTLGDIERLQYEATGDPALLHQALLHTREAMEAASPDTAAWSTALSNHANVVSLSDRPEDLRAAEQILRQAIARSSLPGIRALASHNCGVVMSRTAELTGDGVLMAEAIGHLEDAIMVADPSDLHQISFRRNLAHALVRLWVITSDPGALDRAIDIVAHALLETSRSAVHRHMLHSLQASLLVARFREGRDTDDLAAACRAARRGLALAPSGHVTRPAYHTQYGEALLGWSVHGNQPEAAAEAYHHMRQGLEGAEDSPGWVKRALFLADALISGASDSSRKARRARKAMRAEALDLYRRAATHRFGSPAERWAASFAWAHLMAEERDVDGALEGLSAAIEVLPQLAWPGLSREDQLRPLGGKSEAVCDAAALAILLGKPQRAVELLEQGRAQLLSHALDMNADLEDIRVLDPALAEDLEGVRRQLTDNGPFISDRHLAVGDAFAHAGRRRELHLRWTDLVERARRLPGMAGFLRPPSFDELVHAGDHGPVVLFNISGVRCDALILTQGTVVVVPLPAFDRGKAEARAEALAGLLEAMDSPTDGVEELRDYLVDLLGWLWQSLIRPVLDRLESSGSRDSRSRRPMHLWLCPTDVLNRLPLHAAGLLSEDPYDGESAPPDLLVDRAICSYVPTLRSLLSARKGGSDQPARAPRMLAISVGGVETGTAGRTPLTHVSGEIDAVVARFPNATPLREQDATREAVLAALPAHDWLHFAGHGSQDVSTPDGTLYTWDPIGGDYLKVTDIAALRLRAAELAYLSACQTQRATVDHPDEPVTLAGALRLAGFRHVIATYWNLRSRSARQAAVSFYDHLLAGRSSDDLALSSDDAAAALRAAVRQLVRDRPEAPEIWAALVHVGP
ncbi:CHAT domain-containing protein [Kitasatospora sp. NPDC092039]|uniref:CHAT domain-containing protein n=1 Tax=Kitasatospora sp. NPDC092039 TaxID=3364086 RepID=UPI0037FD0FF7